MISSKTSNISKTNACSKEHSHLFPVNLNAFKVNKNNNDYKKIYIYDYRLFGNTFQEKLLLYRNLSFDLQSATIDWFLCLFYLLFYLFLLYKGVYIFIALAGEPV